MGIRFRVAGCVDAPRLVALIEELGYPSAPARVQARLERLLTEPDQLVLVAEEAGEILGWIHAQEFLTLASEPVALVSGLVVDPSARRRGIGRGLLARVEEWARARRLTSLRLRTRVTRREAHAFYQHLGFEAVKTQLQFRKDL